jgi:predicted NAD/FAD-binding protein
VLHTDSRLLPRRRAARAAWNFHLLAEPKPLSTVTYYMNHLQRLQADRDFCVTLNRSEAIDPEKVIRTIAYEHPVYTPAGVSAQARHRAISGLHSRTHYCGAYWGWGFHEDGVRSALQACEPFGVRL